MDFVNTDFLRNLPSNTKVFTLPNMPDINNDDEFNNHKKLLKTSKSYKSILFSVNDFRTDEFMTKKVFTKYANKTKDRLRNYVYECTKIQSTFEEFAIDMCLMRFEHDLGVSDIPIDVTPAALIHVCDNNAEYYNKESLMYKPVLDLVQYFIKDTDKRPKEWLDFVNIEIKHSLLDWFSQALVNGERISTDNCFSFYPNEADYPYILSDTLSKIYWDIDRYIVNIYFDKFIDTAHNKMKEACKQDIIKYQADIDELSKSNLKLSKELDEKNKELSNILPTIKKYKKEAEEGNNAQKDMFDSVILDKNKEIKALEKKLQSITDKYIRLKESLNEDVEDEIIDSITNNCDTSLNYVFVLHDDWIQLVNQLEKEFPNSKQIGDKDLSIADNTKLVIFMTAYMSHRLYYRVKQYCQAHNIPYMHYSSTNIDKLKTEIANKLLNTI